VTELTLPRFVAFDVTPLQNGHRSRGIGTYVGGLATIAILFWLGALWRFMRTAEGAGPMLATSAVAGGVVGLGSGWLAVALERREKLEEEEGEERTRFPALQCRG